MRISRTTLQQLVILTGLTPRDVAVQTGFPLAALHTIMSEGRSMSVNDSLRLLNTATVSAFARLLGVTSRLEVMDQNRVIYWTFPDDASARKAWFEAFQNILRSDYQLDAGENVKPSDRSIFSTDSANLDSVGREMAVLHPPARSGIFQIFSAPSRQGVMLHDVAKGLKIYISGRPDRASVERIRSLFNPTSHIPVATTSEEVSMCSDLAKHGVLRPSVFLQLMKSRLLRFTFAHVEMAAAQYGVSPDALIDVMFRSAQKRVAAATGVGMAPPPQRLDSTPQQALPGAASTQTQTSSTADAPTTDDTQPSAAASAPPGHQQENAALRVVVG